MIALLLVTEAERTTQTFTALIIALVVVAVLIGILTIWYWRHTSPKRRYRRRVEGAQPRRQEVEHDRYDRYDDDGHGTDGYDDGRYRDNRYDDNRYDDNRYDDNRYDDVPVDHGYQGPDRRSARADGDYPQIYSRVPGEQGRAPDEGVVRSSYQQVSPGTFARQVRGEDVEPRPTGELPRERSADRRR
ncbi:MAG: hypothetical protein ACK5RL_16525 [Acidimicrobiales bacterium]